eukprot:Amastigsp_a3434_25.p3 type:complete len:232 gc:universal Amastigsp_a3434_25:719-24(-)
MVSASSNACARSASFPSATNETSPKRCASVASNRLPVNASSRTVESLPTTLENRARVPRSATIPRPTSATEKNASADARRTSQARTKSTPPPMQAPDTAAITGTAQFATRSNASCHGTMIRERVRIPRRAASTPASLSSSPPPRADATSRTSSPAENAFPSPYSTTARTAAMLAISRNTASISRKKARFIEFRFSGLLKRTTKTPEARSSVSSVEYIGLRRRRERDFERPS